MNWARAASERIQTALPAQGDPNDATVMAAYMRDQFEFLGVKTPAREAVWREVRRDVVAAHGRPVSDDLVAFAVAMWTQRQREFHYVGAKALAAGASTLGPEDLGAVEELILTHSWWDTVDILSPSVVGPMSRRHAAGIVPVLDGWLLDENEWLVRSAVLHQLKAKRDTDVERLAGYCRAAAPRPEFFVRKAIGWALRQYSYVDAEWVMGFVDSTALSPLSEREALKAIRRQSSSSG